MDLVLLKSGLGGRFSKVKIIDSNDELATQIFPKGGVPREYRDQVYVYGGNTPFHKLKKGSTLVLIKVDYQIVKM